MRLDVAGGEEITLLSRSDGGEIYAEVTEVLEAGAHFARKHLGLPRYEAFVIPVGAAMSDGLFAWVAGSWGAQPAAMSGAVLTGDHNFNVQREATFSGALIAETRVPDLDAASRAVGFLTIRFEPEFINTKPGAGTLSFSTTKQKLWRSSNFRLAIDGLDCTKVKKIDSFAVTRKITEVRSGSGEISLVPGNVEFPNLKITLSAAGAQSWFDWHHSFVVDGNNGDTFERNGTISFLATDAKKELSRIELHNLGIIRVAPYSNDSLTKIATVTAELYCEEMALAQG